MGETHLELGGLRTLVVRVDAAASLNRALRGGEGKLKRSRQQVASVHEANVSPESGRPFLGS